MPLCIKSKRAHQQQRVPEPIPPRGKKYAASIFKKDQVLGFLSYFLFTKPYTYCRMEPSSRLGDLIAAMTKQEKRYFKLYSSFYAKKTNKKCEQLFDYINKSKAGNADDLQKKLSAKFPAKSLPRLKNELTTLILDSLVSFRSQYLLDADALTALQQVEVLMEKGLYQHAKTLVDRAKKKARESESYPLQMQALFWERSLLLSRYDKHIDLQLTELYKEVEQTLRNQRIYQQYLKIQDFVSLLWGSDKLSADSANAQEMQSYIDNPLIQDENSAVTPRSKIARLHVLGVYALSRSDVHAAAGYFGQIVTMLECSPALVKNNANQYIRFLLQHLACLVEIRNEADATVVAKKIKRVEQLPTHMKIVSILGALGLELTLFLNLGKLENARRIVEDVESVLDDKRQAIHPQTFINLCYNCAVYNFLSGNNAKALEYINQILDESRIVLRKDLQECARAYNLILHYELGHIANLEYLFRSTCRFLKQRDRLESLEKIVLNWVRKLLSCVDRYEELAVFENFYTELRQLREQTTVNALGLDVIFFWVESKIKSCSIDVVYKRHVAIKNTEP